MSRSFNLLSLSICLFFSLTISCQSTLGVKGDSDSKEELSKLSSADLAQLKDAHKLNPDDAIISGTIKQMNTDDAMEVVLEVDQVEKRGFSFKENINRGDKISIASRTTIKELKEGQSVLLVISAFIMPGTDVVYNLEKILATL